MACRTLKLSPSILQSDDEAIKIALFRDEAGRICGWFIGPLQIDGGRFSVPYLPRSQRVLGSLAIIRAIEHAERLRLPLCLIDPLDLWDSTWRGAD